LDSIFGMMHLVWAGGGFRAVARVVLAEAHLLIMRMGPMVRTVHGARRRRNQRRS
jgi:hypothetical protein